MMYQRGKEIVMGHLLIPVAGGLFEVRAICGGGMTGLRESMLLMAAIPKPVEGEAQFLSQRQYDDPRHDAMFPEQLEGLKAPQRRHICEVLGTRRCTLVLEQMLDADHATADLAEFGFDSPWPGVCKRNAATTGCAARVA
jgi:hypothetical protein